MKIWFISDTHREHAKLQVPDVDLVIHCGDESNHGNAWFNESEARTFFEWYSALPIPTKIFVPGNHSTAIEKGLLGGSDYPDVDFLIHRDMMWNGWKIFGSPYTPSYFQWSYMKPRLQLDAVWQTIPDDIDILITHGPPKGIFDVTRDMDSHEPIHVGSKSLRRHVEDRIQPKVHAFGHIHDEPGIRNFGVLTQGATQFINCSCCDVGGKHRNNGFVLVL